MECYFSQYQKMKKGYHIAVFMNFSLIFFPWIYKFEFYYFSAFWYFYNFKFHVFKFSMKKCWFSAVKGQIIFVMIITCKWQYRLDIFGFKTRRNRKRIQRFSYSKNKIICWYSGIMPVVICLWRALILHQFMLRSFEKY